MFTEERSSASLSILAITPDDENYFEYYCEIHNEQWANEQQQILLALAAAIHQRKLFTQIFLARPIVPLGNRDIGYLPGDVNEKIGPYMQPLFDNLSVIKQKFKSQSKEFSRN